MDTGGVAVLLPGSLSGISNRGHETQIIYHILSNQPFRRAMQKIAKREYGNTRVSSGEVGYQPKY
jgi:hypothetical protein